MKTQIFANNIKCGGCSSKIIDELGKLDGVESVDVSIETGEVTVNYQGEMDKKAYFVSRLDEIGYPEKSAAVSSNPFEF